MRVTWRTVVARAHRAVHWPARLWRLGYRRWQMLVAAILPSSLWLAVPGGPRCFGIRSRLQGDFLYVDLPSGHTLVKPFLTPGRESAALSEAVTHWLRVILLDPYDTQRYLRPGMVVVDVGANTGSFSLLASRLVGPAGRVVAVEPMPENVAAIREMAAANALSNVTVIEVAVGTESGTARFSRSVNATSRHSTVTDQGGDCVIARQRRLDELVAEQDLRRVDVIKIDVEGAEPAVLQSAASTIRTCRPILVVAHKHLPEHRDLVPEIIREIVPDYLVFAGPAGTKCFGLPPESPHAGSGREAAPAADAPRATPGGGQRGTG